MALAAGERVDPHVGVFNEGMTFTRYYWQLELDGALRTDRPGHRPWRATHPKMTRRAVRIEAEP